MKNAYLNDILFGLSENPRRWLVTGAAGFIGSNLVEALLMAGQNVVGLDNFATGHQRNLDEIAQSVGDKFTKNFRFIKGDIRDLDVCQKACSGIDVVLHQAALGSVPRSLQNPINTNEANIVGFLNMLVAAKDQSVKRFVFAASSSTYGDHPGLPKVEEVIGKPLSPYAVTKYVNELYAKVFKDCYGLSTVGLRYFNVFGRRQDPDGAYAAVIPRWIKSMIQGNPIQINGDGETSRDFCYIDNVLQMNIIAATSTNDAVSGQVFNVAVGDRTTLNSLFSTLVENLKDFDIGYTQSAVYADFRHGDVRHSQASIDKAKDLLNYQPTHNIYQGLKEAMEWYVRYLRQDLA